MKETNPLETQLRSWRPRRPSTRLKWRLFGFSFGSGRAWMVGTLAPATACIMLTLGALGSHGGIGISSSSAINGLVASNWNEAAFVLDGFADKQNHLACATFDSTNRSGFGSNMSSFPPLK